MFLERFLLLGCSLHLEWFPLPEWYPPLELVVLGLGDAVHLEEEFQRPVHFALHPVSNQAMNEFVCVQAHLSVPELGSAERSEVMVHVQNLKLVPIAIGAVLQVLPVRFVQSLQ